MAFPNTSETIIQLLEKEDSHPIKQLRMSGKWDSLSKEERISIRKQFQEMRKQNKEKKESEEKKEFKNPIKQLRMSGKWDSLSKEERLSIRKQLQETRKPKENTLSELSTKLAPNFSSPKIGFSKRDRS